MLNNKFIRTVLLSALLFTLMACNKNNVELTNTTWVLHSSSLELSPAEKRFKPSISFFKEGRLSGSDGCNGFSGTYKTKWARIAVISLLRTQMLCLYNCYDLYKSAVPFVSYNFISCLQDCDYVDDEDINVMFAPNNLESCLRGCDNLSATDMSFVSNTFAPCLSNPGHAGSASISSSSVPEKFIPMLPNIVSFRVDGNTLTMKTKSGATFTLIDAAASGPEH